MIGLTQQVVSSIKATLDCIPDPENTNIGIIGYSSSVQFFSFTSELSGEPSIVYVSDVINPFCPLPRSSMMLNVKNCRSQIDSILDKIALSNDPSEKSRPPRYSGSCGGAALKSAIELLGKSSGKVLWFLMDIPWTGYGALKSRNQYSLYNGNKENTLYKPDENAKAYFDMQNICIKDKVTVDIFACTQTDVDLATLSAVSTAVGGD